MTTRYYEALVIFRPMGNEQDAAKSASQLEALVKRIGGRVAKSEQMGRRRLAFRIERQTEGYYHLLRFDAPTAKVAELQRLLRLNETIVRFMILSEEELGLPERALPARARRARSSSPPGAGGLEPSQAGGVRADRDDGGAVSAATPSR